MERPPGDVGEHDDHENEHREAAPPPQRQRLEDDESRGAERKRTANVIGDKRPGSDHEVDRNDEGVGKPRPACDP